VRQDLIFDQPIENLPGEHTVGAAALQSQVDALRWSASVVVSR
jgi:hypothetical protein